MIATPDYKIVFTRGATEKCDFWSPHKWKKN
jgi:hypothetical protein